MAVQPHHSIGEVLSLLQAEYSDVTISKIRFLESQGLIAPERTPSGYRKFYPSDIARLRWILTQQRDNFLPLKVIKKRLEEPGLEVELEALKGDEATVAPPTLFANRDKPAVEPEPVVVEPVVVEPVAAVEVEPEPEARRSASAAAVEPATSKPAADKPAANKSAAEKPAAEEQAAENRATNKPAAENRATNKPAANKQAANKAKEPPREEGATDEPEEPVDGLSATGLAEAAGVEVGLVRELDRLGLIVSVGRSGSPVYGPEALEMANAAAVFGRSGLEPRHIRMYKVSAERQAGLLEQVFLPRLAKGGDSLRQARDELNELVRLGEALQRSILRRSFGESLDA
ncbi:MAG: MerR family DNA-binding transcriptional regulator [Acidimicrobiia bacterium]|nr:MerR family DNA-binding transcriptional regulator [Acidimicrobiia bacterium]